MAGWTKLFGSIVTSSIWCEDNATRLVWIAMLATCDAEGIVEGSAPGFANLCRVTLSEFRAALSILTNPDPDSRTSDYEGRRIEEVAGGWRILNYAAYRERGQAKDGSRAPYMKNRRKAAREAIGSPSDNAAHRDVTRYTEAEERREKKEERREEANPSRPPRGRKRDLSLCPIRQAHAQETFDRIWKAWPGKRGDGKDARGNRIPAERAFQAILDTGEVTTPELEAAAQFYLEHHPNVQAGFIQMVSTFFGPEKQLWAEAVRTLRQRAAVRP